MIKIAMKDAYKCCSRLNLGPLSAALVLGEAGNVRVVLDRRGVVLGTATAAAMVVVVMIFASSRRPLEFSDSVDSQ